MIVSIFFWHLCMTAQFSEALRNVTANKLEAYARKKNKTSHSKKKGGHKKRNSDNGDDSGDGNGDDNDVNGEEEPSPGIPNKSLEEMLGLPVQEKVYYEEPELLNNMSMDIWTEDMEDREPQQESDLSPEEEKRRIKTLGKTHPYVRDDYFNLREAERVAQPELFKKNNVYRRKPIKIHSMDINKYYNQLMKKFHPNQTTINDSGFAYSEIYNSSPMANIFGEDMYLKETKEYKDDIIHDNLQALDFYKVNGIA